MDFSRPLHWHKGLFLEPQHFQYLQSHLTDNVQAAIQLNAKYQYGISRLELNKELISAGIIEINYLVCKFRDNTVVTCPGNATIPQISLEGESPSSEGYYDVYASLIPLSLDSNNISTSNSNRQRFVENEVVALTDLFDDTHSANLRTLQYDVRLFVGKPNDENSHVSVHIARLHHSADGFEICNAFIPPVQYVSDSAVLMNFVKHLSGNLVQRFEQLESFTSLAGNRYVDINGASIANLLAMNTLSHFIPVFSHIANNRYFYIEDLYLICRQLISNLSMYSKSVSVEGNLSGQDIYDFNLSTLSESFQQIMHILDILLSELTIDPEKMITMQRDGKKHLISLPSDFLESNTSLYLRFRTSTNIEKHLDDITRFAKLGADGQIEIYAKRALPGVKLTYLVRKPLGVASTPNSFYFAVDRFSFEWQKVVELGRLGLVWSDSPDDLSIDIIAVRG